MFFFFFYIIQYFNIRCNNIRYTIQINLLSKAVKESHTGCRLSQCGGKWPTDAGAYGVKIVLEAILEKYKERLAVEQHERCSET